MASDTLLAPRNASQELKQMKVFAVYRKACLEIQLNFHGTTATGSHALLSSFTTMNAFLFRLVEKTYQLN